MKSEAEKRRELRNLYEEIDWPNLIQTVTDVRRCIREEREREEGLCSSPKKYNMGDVVKVERMIMGLDAEESWADVNGDGVIDYKDIEIIERRILGLPDEI